MRRALGICWSLLLVGSLLGTGCGGDDDDDDAIDAAADNADAPSGADASAVPDAAAPADSPSSTTCEDDYTDVSGECDLLLQDCEAGYWCKVVSTPTGMARCVENGSGTVDQGEPCTPGNNECKAGLICAAGHCTPYCCPSTNAPCGTGTCDQYVWYGGPTYALVCSY